MLRRFFLVGTSVTLGLMAGLVLTGRMRTANVTSAAPAPPESEPQAARAAPAPPSGLPDLTNIAQRAIGSVTNISSTQIVRTPLDQRPVLPLLLPRGRPVSGTPAAEPRLRRGRLGRRLRADQQPRRRQRRRRRARSAWPTSASCAPRSSAPIALTDIAVLKLDATNLPVLGWGDSSKLRVAEWVLAIGNPFQLNQTVTLGIVSATNRRLEGRVADYEDFIQTDAAINPGNSGGALINARGELVGINTAIYSESGGYQGIGFAVPSNLARHVMDDIIKFGGVRRGTIRGVQLQPMTPQIAGELGAPDARGVLVLGINRSSDAYTSGTAPVRHHRQLQQVHDRRRVAVHPPPRRRRNRQHRDADRMARGTPADGADQDRTGGGD